MTTVDLGLPLPPAVLARLRTADSLRAELAGITAERDALRAELDMAGWERDTAQNEAAYLRDDVLRRDAFPPDQPRRIGLLLTMGDTPPAPPTGQYEQDIALVSLSSGDLYIRPNPSDPDQWAQFGRYGVVTDFATMAQSGPWITVEGPALARHKEKAELTRRLGQTLYNVTPGVAPWPENAQRWIGQITDLQENRHRSTVDPAAWINAWHGAATAARHAWEQEAARADNLSAVLAKLPHKPQFARPAAGGEFVCTLCRTPESEHVAAEVPA